MEHEIRKYFSLHRIMHCRVRCILGTVLLHGRKRQKVEHTNDNEFNQPSNYDFSLSSYRGFSVSTLGPEADHTQFFPAPSVSLSLKSLTRIYNSRTIWRYPSPGFMAAVLLSPCLRRKTRMESMIWWLSFWSFFASMEGWAPLLAPNWENRFFFSFWFVIEVVNWCMVGHLFVVRTVGTRKPKPVLICCCYYQGWQEKL